MPLDFQIIEFPLNAGADTSTEDGTSMEPRVATNYNFDKMGSPVKRRGFETLASSRITRLAASLTGSLTASVRPWSDTSRLIDNDGELLRLTAGELDAFTSGAQGWSFKGFWPNGLCYTDVIDGANVMHLDTDVASLPSLGRTIRCWTSVDPSQDSFGKGQRVNVWAELIDDASGARLLPKYLLDWRYLSSLTNVSPRNCRTVIVKDSNGVHWGIVLWESDGLTTGTVTTRTLRYASFNMTTAATVGPQAASVVSFITDFGGPDGLKWDVSAELGLDGAAASYVTIATLYDLAGTRKVGYTLHAVGTDGTLQSGAGSSSNIAGNPSGAALRGPVLWSNGDRIFSAYAVLQNAYTHDVRAWTPSMAGGTLFHGIVHSHSGALADKTGPYMVGIAPTYFPTNRYPATASITWNVQSGRTTGRNGADGSFYQIQSAFWTELEFSGSALPPSVYGPRGGRRIDGLHWASRPFITSGSLCAWTTYATLPQGTLFGTTPATSFLVEVPVLQGTTGSNVDTPRWLSTAFPRSALETSGSTTFPRVTSSSLGWLTISKASGSFAGASAIHSNVVRFNDSVTAAVTRFGVIAGGGAPWIYDGENVFEIGYATEPEIVAAGISGNALPAYGTAYLRATWEWEDAKGNVHISVPSPVQPITNPASSWDIESYAHKLPLTMKGVKWGTRNQSTRERSAPRLTLYRTTVNGATALKTETTNIAYNVGQDGVDGAQTYTDSLRTQTYTNDAVLTGSTWSVPLYTEGDVLDNVIPPSSRFVLEWKGCIVLAGTPDDSLWFSKPLEDGTAPGFNDTLVQPQFEGGRAQAIAVMDSNLVVLKRSSIWAITGEPPDNLGNSTLSQPQKVIEGVGCVDPMSVVQTPEGIMFRSDRGIVLLDKSLGIQNVGEPVRDQHVGSVVSAHVDAQRGLVRFFQDSPARIFDFHRELSARLQKPTWTVQELRDVDNLDSSNFGRTRARASTLWAGRTVWAGASGSVFLEMNDLRFDSGSVSGAPAGSQHFVSGTYATAIMRPLQNQVGLARFRKVLFRGDAKSQAGVRMEVTSSWTPEAAQWTAGEVNGIIDSNGFTTSFKPANQKTAIMQVVIKDIAPTGSIGTGEGIRPRSIAVEVGAKKGSTKNADAGKK